MLVTEHPVLDSWNAINAIIRADIDSTDYQGIGSRFAYLRADTKAYDYRIYKTPLFSNAISGDSFSTYFYADAPFVEKFGVRIPVLYSDIAVTGKAIELENMVSKAWLYTQSVIETLRDYPHLPLNGQATCGFHMITDIEPLPLEEITKNIFLLIITFKHLIFPMGINP